MNTQERLDRYKELLSHSEGEARAFLEENRKDDKRFVSLVHLRSALLAAFKAEYADGEEDDLTDAIKEELISLAPGIARRVRSRLLATA